ncbi:unnamed protein product [Fasciola hepatica]|uniref:ATP-dependent DNA helicase n=1 Tax=Fasciola hepatica TaxID=6192 RepID=A0ABC9HGU1_FASHE
MRGLVTNLNQYTLRYGRDFPNDFRRTLNQRVRTLNQHFRDAATDRKLLTNENILERLLLQLVHLQDPSPRTEGLTFMQNCMYDQMTQTASHGFGEIIFATQGGSSERFLFRFIPVTIRSTNGLTACASSGLAARLPSGGRIAHSASKLSWTTQLGETHAYNISKAFAM